MGKLVKFQTMEIPKLFLVGKAYTYNMEEHMKNNQMGAAWDECLSSKLFAPLEAQKDFVFMDASVGWMGDWMNAEGNFTYLIGTMMKEGFTLPDGYDVREIEPCTVAVGWIQGKDPDDICPQAHEYTQKALQDAGFSCEKTAWSMEVYANPRFTVPDGNGNVIMDYYIPCD